MNTVLIIPVILPAIIGIFLLLSSASDKWKDRPEPCGNALKRLHAVVAAAMIASAAFAMLAAWGTDSQLILFNITEDIPVLLKTDELGRFYTTFITIIWSVVMFYSFAYMNNCGKEKRFFGFYLIVYGVMIGQCFAGNLVTMYLFFEIMTLSSMPLVLHNGTKEATLAALKYLFYSMFGAYLGLFAIFVLYRSCGAGAFVSGGILNPSMMGGDAKLILAAVFCGIIGFGVKAGMFPLHAWLPSAHPVAPSPASAVLSGIIVKCGVLSIIRLIFYVVGPENIRGTWVQTAWMILALITVFMGSMLAYREKVFKKRLAYSTVSQASYILFGLSVLTATAFTGALLHIVFHAFIKCALFLTAGIIIFITGKTRTDEYTGIGKEMPKTLWFYTLASLALIGIPPTSGFISKWYLAEGALSANIGIFSYLGPIILLVSALLTAGYLLPITLKGFFPGKTPDNTFVKKEAKAGMLVPLGILAVAAVVLGVFPNPLTDFLNGIANLIM